MHKKASRLLQYGFGGGMMPARAMRGFFQFLVFYVRYAPTAASYSYRAV
ncbi:MAG: hypothetical protein H7Z73_08420 [Candidatus Saccharibacteria bacterium]|nr:hypothetical protein [Moraxellaceae bacterium]